jgi:RNA polymerase sigma factor (TIGR02999 family)
MPGPAAALHEGEHADRLFAEVYAQLKRMAHRRLADVPRAALDTTELVHELYLRVGKDPELRFAGQAQFFAYAARAMRHLLLDRARDCMRLRAGGDWARVTLDGEDVRLAIESAEQALALDQALAKLAETDARAARVLELRYFAGLSVDQAAEALGVAPRSVDRDWRFARAFLHDQLAAS